MNESEALLRSAYQIASRNGEDTNWEAFKNSLEKELLESKGVKYPCEDEQLVLRATCTARIYKISPSE
jgi:thiamine pyrophosphokinase